MVAADTHSPTDRHQKNTTSNSGTRHCSSLLHSKPTALVCRPCQARLKKIIVPSFVSPRSIEHTIASAVSLKIAGIFSGVGVHTPASHPSSQPPTDHLQRPAVDQVPSYLHLPIAPSSTSTSTSYLSRSSCETPKERSKNTTHSALAIRSFCIYGLRETSSNHTSTCSWVLPKAPTWGRSLSTFLVSCKIAFAAQSSIRNTFNTRGPLDIHIPAHRFHQSPCR